ncbi:hypothetical protein LINGRAHAP2_LOCUS33626, partial [Linum grandiflorum]
HIPAIAKPAGRAGRKIDPIRWEVGPCSASVQVVVRPNIEGIATQEERTRPAQTALRETLKKGIHGHHPQGRETKSRR